jgi:hypothetical protein
MSPPHSCFLTISYFSVGTYRSLPLVGTKLALMAMQLSWPNGWHQDMKGMRGDVGGLADS